MNLGLLRQGGISFTDLCTRVINVAAEQGWISKEQLRETRITVEVWEHFKPPPITSIQGIHYNEHSGHQGLQQPQ